MQIAVTGSSGLIGTALIAGVAPGRARGDPGAATGRRSHRDASLHWDPAAGAIDAGGLRGARRGGAPGGRRDRRQALDRRAEAEDPREPHRADRAARRDAGRTRSAARGARLGLGDRVVRRPGLRGADGVEPRAPSGGLRRRRVPPVGGGDRGGRGRGHPDRPPPDRHRPGRRGWGAAAHGDPVQARPRRSHRLGQAVHELDRASRTRSARSSTRSRTPRSRARSTRPRRRR